MAGLTRVLGRSGNREDEEMGFRRAGCDALRAFLMRRMLGLPPPTPALPALRRRGERRGDLVTGEGGRAMVGGREEYRPTGRSPPSSIFPSAVTEPVRHLRDLGVTSSIAPGDEAGDVPDPASSAFLFPPPSPVIRRLLLSSPSPEGNAGEGRGGEEGEGGEEDGENGAGVVAESPPTSGAGDTKNVRRSVSTLGGNTTDKLSGPTPAAEYESAEKKAKSPGTITKVAATATAVFFAAANDDEGDEDLNLLVESPGLSGSSSLAGPSSPVSSEIVAMGTPSPPRSCAPPPARPTFFLPPTTPFPFPVPAAPSSATTTTVRFECRHLFPLTTGAAVLPSQPPLPPRPPTPLPAKAFLRPPQPAPPVRASLVVPSPPSPAVSLQPQLQVQVQLQQAQRPSHVPDAAATAAVVVPRPVFRPPPPPLLLPPLFRRPPSPSTTTVSASAQPAAALPPPITFPVGVSFALPVAMQSSAAFLPPLPAPTTSSSSSPATVSILSASPNATDPLGRRRPTSDPAPAPAPASSSKATESSKTITMSTEVGDRSVSASATTTKTTVAVSPAEGEGGGRTSSSPLPPPPPRPSSSSAFRSGRRTSASPPPTTLLPPPLPPLPRLPSPVRIATSSAEGADSSTKTVLVSIGDCRRRPAAGTTRTTTPTAAEAASSVSSTFSSTDRPPIFEAKRSSPPRSGTIKRPLPTWPLTALKSRAWEDRRSSVSSAASASSEGRERTAAASADDPPFLPPASCRPRSGPELSSERGRGRSARACRAKAAYRRKAASETLLVLRMTADPRRPAAEAFGQPSAFAPPFGESAQRRKQQQQQRRRRNRKTSRTESPDSTENSNSFPKLAKTRKEKSAAESPSANGGAKKRRLEDAGALSRGEPLPKRSPLARPDVPKPPDASDCEVLRRLLLAGQTTPLSAETQPSDPRPVPPSETTTTATSSSLSSSSSLLLSKTGEIKSGSERKKATGVSDAGPERPPILPRVSSPIATSPLPPAAARIDPPGHLPPSSSSSFADAARREVSSAAKIGRKPRRQQQPRRRGGHRRLPPPSPEPTCWPRLPKEWTRGRRSWSVFQFANDAERDDERGGGGVPPRVSWFPPPDGPKQLPAASTARSRQGGTPPPSPPTLRPRRRDGASGITLAITASDLAGRVSPSASETVAPGYCCFRRCPCCNACLCPPCLRYCRSRCGTSSRSSVSLQHRDDVEDDVDRRRATYLDDRVGIAPSGLDERDYELADILLRMSGVYR